MKYRICLFVFLRAVSILAIPNGTSEKTVSAAGNSIESFVAQVKNIIEQQKSFIPNVILKKQVCTDLVGRGIDYLKSVSLETACYDFIYSDLWRRGEIFNFLLDEEGYFLCHGDSNHLIWKNINSALSFSEQPIFDVIKKVSEEGQWVYYKWNNGFKFAYVKKIILQGRVLYLGAGFFPQDKDDIAEQLVKTTIAYFSSFPQEVAFNRISNPNDDFVFGDVSASVLDFKGNVFAHSSDLAFKGQNILNYTDSKGDHPVQNIINGLKTQKSAWVKWDWLGNVQKSYIEKTHDEKTDEDYLFVASYLIGSTESKAVDLLSEAITHIKDVGAGQAFIDFSNPLSKYSQSAIPLFVYDFEGKNMADSEYPTLVGQNLFNRRDAVGKLIVQDIISLAQKRGEGIIITYDRNSYKKLFFKVLSTPEGKFIVGTGVYTQTKKITVEAMVERAIRFLKRNSLVEAMKAFSDPVGKFYLGDIYLFMYNAEGIALLNGEHKNIVWQDYIKTKDDDGVILLERLIRLAKDGGGWLKYFVHNAERRVFVRPIYIENKNKKKELFILGSGYFL